MSAGLRLITTVVGAVRDDPRYLVASFLTVILVAGHVWLRFLESLGQFAVALTVALAAELALSRIYRGEWPNPVSSYMTGVSIGILVRSPAVWPYAMGSLLGIGQKYVVQFRRRHLFNPSNFGLSLLLLAAPETVAALGKQWTNLPAVSIGILTLGALVIGRLRRLHLVGTYVGGFVLLTIARGAITGSPFLAELGEIFGPPFQLFVFFMITDPKTSPSTTARRVAYAAAVAVVEAVFRLARVVNAPFYSLLLVSPVATCLDVARNGATTSADARPPSAIP